MQQQQSTQSTLPYAPTQTDGGYYVGVGGGPVFGISATSGITTAGTSIDDVAILPQSGSPDDIQLPTYTNSFFIEQRNPEPLVQLDLFEPLRKTIIHARQLIFAAYAPRGGKVIQNRVSLSGDERNFDYTLALHLYGSPDLTGNFGLRPKEMSTASLPQVNALMQDQSVAEQVSKAKMKLAELEESFRKGVVVPLEHNFLGKESGAASWLRRKSVGLIGGGTDYKTLAKSAGPVILEAKDIHLELERCVLEAVKSL